jgi:hypothetical protein
MKYESKCVKLSLAWTEMDKLSLAWTKMDRKLQCKPK